MQIKTKLLSITGLVTVMMLPFTHTANAGSPNLLRNADFSKTTSGTTPDYWDLNHSGATVLESLENQYHLDPYNGPGSNGIIKSLLVQNSLTAFSFLNVHPTIFAYTKTAPGNYVFSVWARALVGGSQATLRLDQNYGSPTTQSCALTTNWQRCIFHMTIAPYDVTNPPSNSQIHPVMYFLGTNTYWVAMPQLEVVATPTTPPTAFQLNDVDLLPQVPENVDSSVVPTLVGAVSTRGDFLAANFEYNLYTTETKANLLVKVSGQTTHSLVLDCRKDNSGGVRTTWPFNVTSGASTNSLTISQLQQGFYWCLLTELSAGMVSAGFWLKKLAPPVAGAPIAKMQQSSRILRLGPSASPFQIRGIYVGGFGQYGSWYFQDLVNHGINTVLCTLARPDSSGNFSTVASDAFINSAKAVGLKVVLGIPSAGTRPASPNQIYANFVSQVVAHYHNESAILGWYILDEPKGSGLGAWTESEVIEVSNLVQRADPYRIVLINWTEVPAVPGDEPYGSLAATDFYSLDRYPFTVWLSANWPDTLARTLKVEETALARFKASHIFVQMYGGGDAYREPTREELDFLVYLNLIYGSHYSYFDTRAISASLWAQVKTTNDEAARFFNAVTSKDEARILIPPTESNGVIYSAWSVDNDRFIMALNYQRTTANFSLDLAKLKFVNKGISASNFEMPSQSVTISLEGLLTSTIPILGHKVFKVSGLPLEENQEFVKAASKACMADVAGGAAAGFVTRTLGMSCQQACLSVSTTAMCKRGWTLHISTASMYSSSHECASVKSTNTNQAGLLCCCADTDYFRSAQ